MTTFKKIIFISLLTSIFHQISFAQQAVKPLTKEEKMKWWSEAKFGMFIHWGLYAITARGEWEMRRKKWTVAKYGELAQQFNPVKFNADEWVKIAKNAGMKHIVIITKHHDGFALFDTKASDFDIMDASPFKRDIVKELADACKKNDIKFGIYYSTIADWHHKGGQAGEPHWDPTAQDGDLNEYVKTVAEPQVRELLTKYGSISEIWFDNDGSKGITKELAAPFHQMIAELQPQAIVCPRLAGGDFDVQEQHISPLRPKSAYWEACITSNGMWGYTNNAMKSTKKILTNMIDIVSKGGNILLNVGPDAQGLIPAENVLRMNEIGAWLKTNGESFYGAKPGPFDYLSWGKATQKGNIIYLHIFDYPADSLLRLPLDNKITKAYFLSNKKKTLKTYLKDGKSFIQLPSKGIDANVNVVAIEVKGEVKRQQSLCLNKPTTSNLEAKHNKHFKLENAFDDDPSTRFNAKKDTIGTIDIDLQAPTTFSTLRVGYGSYTAVAIGRSYGQMKKFALKYKDGEEWKTIFEDVDMPVNEYIKKFPPITAQFVRFEIGEIKGAMDIASFELFAPEN